MSKLYPECAEALWEEYLNQLEWEPSVQGAISFAFERLTCATPPAAPAGECQDPACERSIKALMDQCGDMFTEIERLRSLAAPSGGESREADAWMRTWPNGDKTFTRQKPQELGGRPLTPLYAPTAMAQSNGDAGELTERSRQGLLEEYYGTILDLRAQLEAARKALEAARQNAIQECIAIAEQYDDCGISFVVQKFRDAALEGTRS